MRVLHRKLARELLGSAGILLAVVSIIAVGTGAFIGVGSAQRILENSQRQYYRAYRFADLWVELKKAPLSVVERLAEWPELAALRPRISYGVILEVAGVARPLTGRLISAPRDGMASAVNGVCLVRGDGFSTDRDEEVILAESFAAAHGLDPGDHIHIILNHKRQSFVIAGTAISPEFVYMVQGEGSLMPDPEHFGVLYIKEDYAREVLDFRDACNELVGLLAPGHTDRAEAVLERMKPLLEPYGLLAAMPRSRQPSHRFVSDEIRGLAVTALIMPGVFLLVAALALNHLMGRLAERQRGIIGTLKALGYTNREVLNHFLLFGMCVGVVGGIIGIGVGMAMTHAMIETYRSFYQFPNFRVVYFPDLMAGGVGVSLAFAVLGTLRGVWRIFALQPAAAMRPRPPQAGGTIFLERWPALWRCLGFRTHWALRNLVRDTGRTAAGVFSFTMSTAIVFLTLSMYMAIAHLVDFQFRLTARSDVDLGLRDERSRAALYEARDLPGVRRAEPVFALAGDLRNGRRGRRVSITGLTRDHQLTIPRQADTTPIPIPQEGLVLSHKLAEILDAGPGTVMQLIPVRGRQDPVAVRVDSIVDTFLGLDCYADGHYLSRLVDQSSAVNGVQMTVDARARDELYARVKRLPNVQALGVLSDVRANIETTVVKTIRFAYGIMILLAGVIALGSTASSALVEMGDRLREIATLRVMGYSAREVAGIFFRQHALVAAAGLMLACPLGMVLLRWLAGAYNTELFRIPVVFHPAVFVATAAIATCFVLGAQVIVYRAVRRVDWREGIQVKE